MLPLQQAYEVKYSIIEYLKATFGFKEKSVQKSFNAFIEEEVFKGPYVSLKLPFVKAKETEQISLTIKPNYPPYDHQIKAFERLNTENGNTPKSTLITTGTSSGKTECFMFPILDFCFKNLAKQGIKVIILYPMNALATDQAKRLAETIWQDERLKGKVTAGLFIGEGKSKGKKFPKDMGENHVIEDQQSIIDSPPDILLTNFKMLDYALMRSKYHNLWVFNFQDPKLLKYLILDELHTYDGAQGTDVANLIRRLKLKIAVPAAHLCAVGTSATIGSSENSRLLLLDYAKKVFGEKFDEESIIVEKRVTVEEFFGESDEDFETFIPRVTGLLESRLKEDETYENYINRQKMLWQLPVNVDEVGLGKELKKLQIVKDLLELTGQHIIPIQELIRKLSDQNLDFRKLPEWDAQSEMNPKEEVINSVLALIAEAKTGSGRKFPFLFLQIQVWVRELSGLLRELNEEPVFTWKDKVGDMHEPKALPAYFCRECGASGWLGVKDDNKNHFYEDAKQVYEYFFSNHKNIYFINTSENKHIEEYEPKNEINDYLDKETLSLYDKEAVNSLKIHAVRKLDDNAKNRHICPECNTENTLGIIGTRIATLSSISVSQILSSNLDPRPEKYRKILAFTNSVQDAAHQAGFVEARNYRFTFRSSLQKVINLQGKVINLQELQDAFVSYWKENADENGPDDSTAYYYRFFPADYKSKVDIDTDFRVGKKFTTDFKKEFDLRMQWEIASEFGFNANIGRTLEKSKASAIKFDEEKLSLVFPSIKAWLEQNNLGFIEESVFSTFVNGILHRIRIRGGVDHEYLRKFREVDLKLWDLNWMKDPRHFLNRYFGNRARLPKLITTQVHSRNILDTTFTNTSNWFRNYFIKSFPSSSNYHAIVNEFYQQLFEVFVSTGLMNKMGDGNNLNYAIRPSAILIENITSLLSCDCCGSELNVAASDNFQEGIRCLNYSCKSGRYEISPKRSKNYYQLVYNRSRSPRIYATEHTGILERRDRENKERDFKERPNHNSLNAIVATSTLEMGIDIGSLNSAINNNVPPLASNFLQRVGRAGRTSGSALVVNFAQTKAHDLFYFDEPQDMMEGEVFPPGCFLEAKDILFRHFFAFCLDTWTGRDPINNTIPATLISLRLLTNNLSDESFFINKITSFVKANESVLLSKFSDFYRPDLANHLVLNDLESYLREELMYNKIKLVFINLKNEYIEIHEKRKEIDAQIKRDNLPETDEDRKILEAEKKALWGLKRIIDKRSILEHLTNKGLLPNYSFPETGVTLNARINSFKAKGSETIPSEKQFEIVRSANVAIREFAPDNSFYSQGFKFEISGINTFDWRDSGILTKKRFCSNCDNLADSVLSNELTCPKCQDASWSSSKNVHNFVRLNAVKSVNTREKSTLDDSKDDRESSHYVISKHVKFHPNSFQGAWGMSEIPFGIEYVKNVDITLLNLGLSTSVDANKILINQIENVPHHGFVTCKSCGKSTSKPHIPNVVFHYPYCKHKEKAYIGKSDVVFEEIYLFKEIKTEALKILLPIQELETESQLLMFKAGFELGLKKYYGGNPQHLAMLDYSEFNSKNDKFDRYLLVYDTIPGGTGYLEKLFDPNEFTAVLKAAYNNIKECSCQHNGKDGCYRCIYTYGNQYNQKDLSREQAEAFFKKIVDKSNAWEPFKTGLGSLSGSGQIEESELEDRFLRSLRNYIKKNEALGYYFESVMIDGQIQYRFKIKRGTSVYYYSLKPQKELGPSDNVRFNTRSDFYLKLVSAEENGDSVIDEAKLGSVKPIAIYLDGYTYHATEDNFRFFTDYKKRKAILDSGEIVSWTLTWNDLEVFDSNLQGDSVIQMDFISPLNKDFQNALKVLPRVPGFKNHQSDLLHSKNNLERLIFLIENPFVSTLNQIIGLQLIHLQSEFGMPSMLSEEFDDYLIEPKTKVDKFKKAKSKEGNMYMLPDFQIDDWQFCEFRLGIKLNDFSFKAKFSLKEEKNIKKLPKDKWGDFWKVFNLIQFGMDNDDLNGENETETISNSYDCLVYYDPIIQEIVKQLIDNDIHFEKEGSFFIEFEGQYPEAMLGFESKKVFICAQSEIEKQMFLKAGYREVLINDFNINEFK
jgi:DEAD/DEAH box helicase domain-containing protein